MSLRRVLFHGGLGRRGGTRARTAACVCLACGLAACSDSARYVGELSEANPVAPEPQPAPVYAVTTTVFDDDTAATYVTLLASLEAGEVELASAREFAGWSSVDAHGAVLFVGHGERPEVARYELTAGGTLGDAERTVSFADYGLSTGSLSFNTLVDGQMAHMALDETSRLLWEPTEMAILRSVDTPQVARERDGLSVTAANFQGRAVREDGVFQPFFWHDADWYRFHQQSQLGIYTREGELQSLLDVPCPALQIATRDEAGNLYFSGMSDTIPYQLREAKGTLERCVARVDAGAHSIAPGWPRKFEELTEGRPTGAFYYVKDGVGLLTVFHTENVDPAAETFLDEWYTDNWGLWLVDLERWRAQPLEQWPLGSANLFVSQLGERLFVHDVEADFEFTTIYELSVDGSLAERLTVPGYSPYPLRRLR